MAKPRFDKSEWSDPEHAFLTTMLFLHNLI